MSARRSCAAARVRRAASSALGAHRPVAVPPLRLVRGPDARVGARRRATYELLAPRMLGARAARAVLPLDARPQSLADLPLAAAGPLGRCCASRSSRCSRSASRASRARRRRRRSAPSTSSTCATRVPDAALEDARARDPGGRSTPSPKDDLVRLVTFARAPARRPARRRRDTTGARRRAPRPTRKRPARRARRRRPTSRARSSSRTASTRRATCGARSSSPTACRPTATSSPRRTARSDFGVKLFAVPYQRPVPGEVAVRDLRVPDKVHVGETVRRPRRRSSRAVPQTVKLVAQAGRGRSTASTACGTVDLKAGRQRRRVQERRAACAGEVTYALELDRDRRGPLQGEQPLRRHRRRARAARRCSTSRATRRARATSRARSPRSSSTSTCAARRAPRRRCASSSATTSSSSRDTPAEARLAHAAGAHRELRARSRRRLPLRRRRERLRPRRLVPHDDRADPAGAHGRREAARRAGGRDGARHRSLRVDDRAAARDGQGRPPRPRPTRSPRDDLLEVIAFDSQPTRIVKMTPAKHRARIQNDIARIQAGGGTEIFRALDAAYQALVDDARAQEARHPAHRRPGARRTASAISCRRWPPRPSP